MFTGLVEKTGRLKALRCEGPEWVVDVSATPWDTPLATGESIAVQGACLTVVSAQGGGFRCNVLDETLRRTCLGKMGPGARLNLERALRMGDRLGGHMVTGHIDGTGRVASVTRRGADTILRIGTEADILAGVVPKGSIACDGVSLTVSTVLPDAGFEVCLIPHTWEQTSLSDLRPDDMVNLETDLIGKYVARWLSEREGGGRGITIGRLGAAGFC